MRDLRRQGGETMSAALPRRDFLTGVFGSVLAAGIAVPMRSRAADLTLKKAAQTHELFWGAAVQHMELARDATFADLVAEQCAVIVPEWEMKWAAIEKHRGKPNFAQADAIVRFASEHGLKLRGHTLIWHRSIPEWAKDILGQPGGWDAVATHIAAMLHRYGDSRFIHWDVLNEVIEPNDGRDDGLRASPFLKAFGPDYIPLSLTLAREAAPGMRLYINEYGVDYDGSVERARRAALLRLVDTLKTEKVPLDGIGIQGHLRLDGSPFSETALSTFLRDLASHGVRITITELDVREGDLKMPLNIRDTRVADEVRRYLDVALQEPAVEGIVSWGLSDRYSWRTTPALRQQGLVNRGLPFDDALRPKAVTKAIVAALERRRPG
jgi:endo-1,4-beta-xylanase